MDKPFLLMAGLHYYPRGGTKDWIGRYATREEAEEAATALIRAKEADDFCADEWSYADERWVEIVDLRTWEATPKGGRIREGHHRRRGTHHCTGVCAMSKLVEPT